LFTTFLTVVLPLFNYLKIKMKTSVWFWIGITTAVLLITTVLATLDFSFSTIFFLTVTGQILLVYMVYRVLTDNYTTDKDFNDFYQDFPRNQ